MKYRVEYSMNDTYRVIDTELSELYDINDVVFNGSISDCEAWIRLKLNEEIDF